MAESKITFAKIKDKVTGNETAVNKLLFTDNRNKIKSLYPSGEITVDNSTKLNGETKEQLLQNLNATTIGGKTLQQIQSRGKFGAIRLITDDNNVGHYYQMFAVNEDEDLIYWGYNHSDQMMMAKVGVTNIPFTIIEHPLRGKSKIKQITQLSTSYFLLYENGDLYGRGYNNYYALGVGNTATQFDWVKITDNVKKFCPGSGGYQTVRATHAVIKKDGSVWFWGENAYGQAGVGNTSYVQQITEVKIDGQPNAKFRKLRVSCHYYQPQCSNVFAEVEIDKETFIYSWGYNGYGQVGANSATDIISKPTRFYLSPDKTHRITQWCINGFSNNAGLFILLDNGQVYGWGYNANNQVLGNGSTISPISFPTLIL